MKSQLLNAAALALPCLILPNLLAEWATYRGPGGAGISPETVSPEAWDNGGPRVAWAVPTPGGFSSFTVAGEKAFTLLRREVDGSHHETCVAFDAASGEELWFVPLALARYDRGGDDGTEDNAGGDGPRSTPIVSEGRVYVLDSALLLSCLDSESGKTLWSHNIEAAFAGRNIRWKNAASPVIDGDRLFVAGGGPNQSFIAFDRTGGEVLWKTGDALMTHATPVVTEIHSRRQIIFFAQDGLHALDVATGEELWHFPYPHRISSAASPVVFQDIVYCSAGYGVGGGACRIEATPGGFRAVELWRKPNQVINHWSTPVCRDGYLYGLYGFKQYGDAPLACYDIRTGEEKWSQEGFGPGHVIMAADRLMVLGDAGQLVLAEASPEAYRELARADVLDGKCWTTPALTGGRVFVRSTEEGKCLDLSPR